MSTLKSYLLVVIHYWPKMGFLFYSVEHVENIGIHYHQILRCWRKNLLENQKKVLALGFDEKFIRTWEYYFDYCAAGFKSRTIGDYQSNDLFSLFLDETMTYSCVVFKSEDEDLKVAQLRKLSLLREKARINKEHEVLDIGCGWGSFAIEIVNKTGSKCTGITLSVEQYKYATEKVNQAGLQDHITIIHCDYRELSEIQKKYARIISIGMIEAVGHEYFEEFFACCDSLLAEDGLFVLQYISMPDQKYDEHRLNPGFIKEYIFLGGCLPS